MLHLKNVLILYCNYNLQVAYGIANHHISIIIIIKKIQNYMFFTCMHICLFWQHLQNCTQLMCVYVCCFSLYIYTVRGSMHTHKTKVLIWSWNAGFLPFWHMISLGNLRCYLRTKGDLDTANGLSPAHATVNQRQLKRALPAKAAMMIYE